jgi:hypothetical protein
MLRLETPGTKTVENFLNGSENHVKVPLRNTERDLNYLQNSYKKTTILLL